MDYTAWLPQPLSNEAPLCLGPYLNPPRNERLCKKKKIITRPPPEIKYPSRLPVVAAAADRLKSCHHPGGVGVRKAKNNE